jgi:hypothetical protein
MSAHEPGRGSRRRSGQNVLDQAIWRPLAKPTAPFVHAAILAQAERLARTAPQKNNRKGFFGAIRCKAIYTIRARGIGWYAPSLRTWII